MEGSSSDELIVDVSRKDGHAVVAVAGELDIATAPTLRAQLVELIEAAPVEVVVDVARLTFLGSTGINLLIGAAKQLERAGGSLRVQSATPVVRRVLEVSGVAEALGLDA
jgi:anti-sigma B factor antagonist